MKEEIWLPVKGFEGRYEVSNFGQVRSLGFARVVKNSVGWMKGRVLRLNKNKPGYYQVFLSGTDRKVHVHSVHRLVATAFIQAVEGKDAVNHINGDRLDNRAENLEWCTLEENTQHSVKVLKNTVGVYTPVKVSIEKDGIKNTFDSMADAARFIGCRNSYVAGAVFRGHKCSGYIVTKL